LPGGGARRLGVGFAAVLEKVRTAKGRTVREGGGSGEFRRERYRSEEEEEVSIPAGEAGAEGWGASILKTMLGEGEVVEEKSQ
jgi:hypothetical protein